MSFKANQPRTGQQRQEKKAAQVMVFQIWQLLCFCTIVLHKYGTYTLRPCIAPSMNLLLVGFRLWISRLCSLLSVSAAYQAFSGNITPQLKVRLLQLDLLPFKFQLFAFSGTQHPIYIFESSYSSCPIFAGRLVQNYDLAVCIGVCPVGQEGNLPMNGCFFLFCFAHICCSARSRRVRKRFSFWAGGPKFTRDCQEICF